MEISFDDAAVQTFLKNEAGIDVVVHFTPGNRGDLRPACGWRINFGSATLSSTRGVRLVTCKNCLRTRAYRRAALRAFYNHAAELRRQYDQQGETGCPSPTKHNEIETQPSSPASAEN